MTPLDIAAEYFPDASKADLDYIIWEHTGFPGFWNIPEDGATPEACFRSQLERYKLHGRACYRCGAYGTGNHGKPVMPRGSIVCRSCRKLLAKEASNASEPKAPLEVPDVE